MIADVIPFRPQPQPISLRLREVLNDESGEITKWFSANSGARAKFRIRVQHLQKIGRGEWNITQFRHLGDGLAEIKWKHGNKQFRAIGFDHQGWFVVVIGCIHKMNVYDPQSCLKTAKIMGEVKDGTRKTREFKP